MQAHIPTVLFVCVHNAGRSQMAAAFFNAHVDARARGLSAGTEPALRVHPEVVEAMREVGIDLEGVRPQLLTQELADSADRLVSMGCQVEEACPALRLPMEDWGLPDPAGRPMDEVRRIRDEVEQRVIELASRLDSEG